MIIFHVISIFPEMFSALTTCGITGRAFKQGLYQLHTHNPRDFSGNKHRKVDDTPFGGGAGMVMMPEPLAKTVQFIRSNYGEQHVVLLSPQGVLWQQSLAQECLQKFYHPSTSNANDNDNAASDFSENIENINPPFIKTKKIKQITLICGRYDGVDQRFIDHYVNQEISLGEFVVSGGELPAMMVLDSIIRLIPNAVGNPDSIIYDSFSKENIEKQQFDYPQYTQPRVFEGQEVPEVLLNGHHVLIDQWREKMAKEAKEAREVKETKKTNKKDCIFSQN